MKYTIKKGRHFSNFTINRLFPFCSSKISGTVKFDKKCLVQGEISGHNKLTGISSLKIHENSGRLVWQSDGALLKIYGYVYNNGVRREQYITSLLKEKKYNYSVSFKSGFWRFEINNITVYLKGSLGFWKMRAYPYFGGVSTAPVQMSIDLT